MTSLVLLLAVAVPLSITTPAVAATGISVPNGVLYEGCRYHPYTLTLAGYYRFDADVTAFDAVGSVSGFDYAYGSGSGQVAGDFLVCGGENAGTWRIEAKVTYYNSSYDKVAAVTVTAYFNMRQPASYTTIGSARKGKLAVVHVSVEAGPNATANCAYCHVAVQNLRARSPLAGITDGAGNFGFRTISKRNRYQATTPGSDAYAPSQSSVTRIVRRG